MVIDWTAYLISPSMLVLTDGYNGRYTVTSWPSFTSSGGSAPTTSASPPVFANGAPSDAAKTICMISSPSQRTLHRPGQKLAAECYTLILWRRPRWKFESRNSAAPYDNRVLFQRGLWFSR